MTVSVRTMTIKDIPAVAELEKLCFSDAWSEAMLTDMLNSEFDSLWVLEIEPGEVAGYINYRFLAGEGELMRIAVQPDKRGCGYSRHLMEMMEKDACEQGIEALTLEVRASNAPAIRLYRSFGFEKEAVRKNYYRDPMEDAIIMWQRSLPVIPS